MDPERLEQLLSLVEKAREQGMSDREINSRLRRNRNVPFNSVFTLETAAEAEGLLGPGVEDDGERSAVDKVRSALTPLIQGATGGFASDVLSGAEEVGLAREGAGERFREDLGEAREAAPIASGTAQITGLLGGPAGRLGARGVSAAGRAAGAAGSRIGGGAASAAGAGDFGRLLGQTVGRVSGATVGGGAAGAAEGGLLGFGEAAGQPVEERLGEALLPGLLGAGLGAAGAGLSSAFQTSRAIRQAKLDRGEVLSDAAERVGRDLPTRRQVSGRVQQSNQQRRELFRQAEEAGQEIPGEVSDFLAKDNPIIQKALRNAANQGSPEARRFLNAMEEFRAGDRASRPAASFELADDIRKQLRFQGETFQRQTSLLGADAAAPSQGAVREAQRLTNTIEGALDEVPGFREAIEESARAGTQARALQEGRNLFSKPADVIEDVVQGKKVQVGGDAVQIANNPEAREAVRAGLAQPVLQRLRGGSAKAENFLSELKSSSELQRKMKVILGGEDSLNQFIQEADRLRAIGQMDRIGEEMIKAAGFLTFGTSLFGGAAATGLLGG